MAPLHLFIRRRDGRIEVRVAESGREFIVKQMARVAAAESDSAHEWHSYLHAPMNPSADADDPLRVFERQKATATNAELALLSAHEEFINNVEAWAWLTTLQIALRSEMMAQGVFDSANLDVKSESEVADIRSLQYVLFELARVVS
ncbi:MAG: hypothetical protein WCG86_00950 [Actinomycetota bacterium]|jgi:hypothetical protein